MRNVPTYTRPRSPEILKVSLRDAGPVSILRHTPVARYPPLRIRPRVRPRLDIKGDVYRGGPDGFMTLGISLGMLIKRRNPRLQILKS